MEFECSRCKFRDKPENYHAYMEIVENNKEHLQNIYVECPRCGDKTFFQHFAYPFKTNKAMGLSHIFSETPPAKDYENQKKIVEKIAKKRNLMSPYILAEAVERKKNGSNKV